MSVRTDTAMRTGAGIAAYGFALAPPFRLSPSTSRLPSPERDPGHRGCRDGLRGGSCLNPTPQRLRGPEPPASRRDPRPQLGRRDGDEVRRIPAPRQPALGDSHQPEPAGLAEGALDRRDGHPGSPGDGAVAQLAAAGERYLGHDDA